MIYSLILCTITIAVVTCQLNGSQLYPWTISMQVADIDGNEYFGGMDMDLVFSDLSQLNFTLPLQQFSRGAKYDFNVQLGSSNQLQYAILRTIGFCLKSMPLEVLRLDWVQFRSDATKSTYMKRLNNVALKDKCQQQRGTVLIDFEETASDKCELDGRSYNVGEQFSIDCSARCHCTKEGVACVDMCPPFGWVNKPNQTCNYINVVGQCCESLMCVNQLGQKITSFTDNSTVSDQQCRFKSQDVLKREYNYGYPAVVLACTGRCEDPSNVRSAVIIRQDWVAIIGNHALDASNLFIYVAKDYHSNYTQYKVKQIVNDPSQQFALLQVDGYLINSLWVQATTLPLTKEQCSNLIAPSCPMTITSWEFSEGQNALDSSKNSIRSHSLKVATSSDCQLSTGDDGSSICIALPNDYCMVPKGDPLFVSDNQVSFFVGFQQQTSKDLQSNGCQKKEFSVGVNVCSSLDWIRETIKIKF